MLRKISIVAAIVGAIGSLGLMFATGNRPPLFLLILFVVWVAGPFAALIIAIRISNRWPETTRSTLYWTTLVVTVLSLVIYLNDVLNPPASTRAFVWVAVPAATALVAAVAVLTSALIAQKR